MRGPFRSMLYADVLENDGWQKKDTDAPRRGRLPCEHGWDACPQVNRVLAER